MALSAIGRGLQQDERRVDPVRGWLDAHLPHHGPQPDGKGRDQMHTLVSAMPGGRAAAQTLAINRHVTQGRAITAPDTPPPLRRGRIEPFEEVVVVCSFLAGLAGAWGSDSTDPTLPPAAAVPGKTAIRSAAPEAIAARVRRNNNCKGYRRPFR